MQQYSWIVNKESRNFRCLRDFASRMSFLASLGLSLVASGSGVEDETQKYKSPAPSAPTTPKEAPRLRLQGVASIGQQETAYFVHTENGLVFGLGVGRLMVSLFVDVGAFDAATFVIAPLLLLGASLGAAWLPARRATTVNPVVALRAD